MSLVAQELTVSTESVILPETVALLLAEEPSLTSAVKTMSKIMLRGLGRDDVVSDEDDAFVAISLKPLIDELELYLHYLIVGMEVRLFSSTFLVE